jgi:manganese-dependent inorganic pyrophosphatase
MPENGHPLIVIGHKNPDTDSICSAVVYASYKTEVDGVEALPFRAGTVNPQTRFVLSRFQTESPPLVTDVYPKIRDIMIPRNKLVTITPMDTVSRASEFLTDLGFTFLPVVDGEDRCVGTISSLRIAGILRDLSRLENGADLGAAARKAITARVREYVEVPHPTFSPGALVRDVLREIGGHNAGGFVVLDDEGRLAGVITRVSFLAQSRLRVVMVDHNELSQAVDGMEEADVVEIIDHHRLANRPTREPVTFINKTVGSTATIVCELYRNAHALPRPREAGLLLSSILSDTVILKSPTTTGLDAEMAAWTAGICGEDIDSLGEQIFAAGAALEGMDAKLVIGQDQKLYQEGNRRFSVSQIETVGFRGVLRRKRELFDELDRAARRDDLSFACLMATDVTRETSLLLFRGDPNVLSAISYPRREEDIFEMKDVLSRKKQVIPYLIDVMKRI